MHIYTHIYIYTHDVTTNTWLIYLSYVYMLVLRVPFKNFHYSCQLQLPSISIVAIYKMYYNIDYS